MQNFDIFDKMDLSKKEEKMTFKELLIGDFFILIPVAGYKTVLLKKIKENKARSMANGWMTNYPVNEPVIRIELIKNIVARS